jgi:hypothetical protein
MLDTLDPKVEKIGGTFRTGSVTAIGVVLAFSLGFLNSWATIQAPWLSVDVGAIALIAVGIAFQICALARMLSIASLEVPTYRRIVQIFLIGLVLVSLGVLLAIGGDALNYSRRLMK